MTNVNNPRRQSFQLTNPIKHQRPYALPVSSSTAVLGGTPAFRHSKVVDALPVLPEDGLHTVSDLVKRAATKFGDRPCVGYRTEIRTHVKAGLPDANGKTKELTVSELSPYKFLSYVEYAELVTNIGYGLVEAGLDPAKDKVCMWAQTSAQWLALYHGAASQSIPIVTAYANLGLSGLQHAVESTDSVAIFVDSRSISRLAVTLKAVPSLRLVIYKADIRISKDMIHGLKNDFQKVEFIEFDDLVMSGKSHPISSKTNTPGPDDLAAIMYTSGSTGTPKGVPIRHKNIVAAIAGWDVTKGHHFDKTDIYLAYLPLAHIMEFISEHVFLFWGVPIGYGSPRTLFSSSVENCKGDLAELAPTYICAVPAILESARKNIINSLTTLPSEQQKVFWDTYQDKKHAFENGTVFDESREKVFEKARSVFGGKLRFMMTGGSNLARNTQEFMSFVVAPVTGGYAMTETTGAGAMMAPDQWHTGSVGGMMGSVEMKLVDYEEAGYFASSNPPEGEVCVRGASIAGTYWKDEEETRRAFTEDGWLRTGDIGRIDEHGALWIIDRKKNLVKNLNGQYIALEKLESIYRSCPVVANVCIYADSSSAKPVAIIIPVEPVLDNLFKSSSVAGQNSEVEGQRLVLQQLQEKAREYDMPSLEIVEGVVISPLKVWDIDNGMTTAVGKLKRKAILEQHQQNIEALRRGSKA